MKIFHPSIRHTVAHLGTAFFVFALALSVGLVARFDGLERQLADTSSSLTTAPVISALRVDNIISSGSRVRWTTDQPSDSRVWYADSTASPGQVSTAVCDGGGMVTQHCVLLTGLLPATNYFYKVESMNSAGLDAQVYGTAPILTLSSTGTNTSTADTYPPSPPLLHLGIVTSSEIDLYWDGATDNVGVVGYEVYKNGNLASRQTGTTYKDSSNLVLGSMNAYWVLSVDAAGNKSIQTDINTNTVQVPSNTTSPTSGSGTSPSSSDTMPPSQPLLTVSSPGAGQVNLSYSASDNVGVYAYRIFRDGTPLTSTPRTQTVFMDSNVQPGSVHTYAVQAVDTAGNLSLVSPNVSITVTGNATISTPPTSTVSPVSFAVSVAYAQAFCDNGKNKTPAAFLISPPDGGSILLSRLEDHWQSTVFATSLALQDGTYHWQASVNSGFVIDGTQNGDFSMLGPCPYPSTTQTASGTAAISISSISTAAQPTIDQLVLTKVFMNDLPLPLGATAKGKIELRVVTSDAQKIDFIDAASANILIGHASIDDLLSNATQDAWVYYWDTTKFPNRTYQVVAKITDVKGTVLGTLPFKLTLQNPVALALSAATAPTSTASPSLTASAPAATIASPVVTETENILTRVVSPGTCGTPNECQTYCGSSVAKKELCSKYISTVVDIAATSTEASTTRAIVTEGATSAPKAATFIDRFTDERQGARIFIDSDSDGISDFDEVNLYHTDPHKFDSDGDGSPDGAEIIAHTNPLGNLETSTSSPGSRAGESVAMGDPKTTGLDTPELFTTPSIVVVATSTDQGGEVRATKIAFGGMTIPNSFVTLYIYSDPIVVTVKSDATGAWTYVLDKELPDGSHEVYTAITDSGGKIVAKSDPIPFVKQAAAVTIGSEAALPVPQSTPGFFSGPGLIALISIIVGVLGIAISIIGFTVRHQQVAETIPP